MEYGFSTMKAKSQNIRNKILNPCYWENKLNADPTMFSRAVDQNGNPVELHQGNMNDDLYEYKHVILTQEQYRIYKGYRDESWENSAKGGLVSKHILYNKLKLKLDDGWLHYYIFPPNPQILCLRRPLKEFQSCDSSIAKVCLEATEAKCKEVTSVK